jgi:transcriptional regulator with XRE-family HTH domain
MRFPNLLWAIRQTGSQFRLAAMLGESESWLSRRLTGRVDFTPEDCGRVSNALGYPADWLFQKPAPPVSTKNAESIEAMTAGVLA